jgi:hypothetical protein
MGSRTIKDFPTDPIKIECKLCDRQGRYRKATLIEKYGRDTVLPDLLELIAGDYEKGRRYAIRAISKKGTATCNGPKNNSRNSTVMEFFSLNVFLMRRK